MYRDNSIVKLKLDVIFKRVFGDENDKDILAAFLSAMLEISRESIRKIEINFLNSGRRTICTETR